MHKFRALVALNLRAMLTSFRFGGRKKRSAGGVGALVFLAVVALYLSGTYSFLFASQLAPMGLTELVVLLVSVMAVAMGLMFTLFAAQGVVFGGKDNDLMLSLPVSAFSLMLSRTLALYAENLLICLFVMLPAGAAYLVYGGGGGAVFLIVLLAGTVFLALLPTLLALAAGFIIAWVSSKFVRRGGLSTLLYVAAFGGFMAVMMRLSFAMTDLTAYAMGLQDAFTGWGLPFLLLMRAACGGDVLSLLGLIALCAAPFLLVVWLFAPRYKRIVTALGSRGARSDYKLGRVAASGCRRALLKKEAKRFFGTPIYLINAGFGLVLLVGGAVASLFFRGTLTGALARLGDLPPLAPLAAAVVCLMVSTAAVTASSVSLEGKQLWILKAAPIEPRGIFLVKAGFQLLLVAPCVLAASACLAVTLSLGIGGWLVMVLAGVSAGLCTALMGLFINLCLPKLDAPNDMVVVKQSASALVSTFGSMILVVAVCALCALLQGPLGWTGAVAVGVAVFLALGGGFWALLAKRGTALFLEL